MSHTALAAIALRKPSWASEHPNLGRRTWGLHRIIWIRYGSIIAIAAMLLPGCLTQRALQALRIAMLLLGRGYNNCRYPKHQLGLRIDKSMALDIRDIVSEGLLHWIDLV